MKFIQLALVRVSLLNPYICEYVFFCHNNEIPKEREFSIIIFYLYFFFIVIIYFCGAYYILFNIQYDVHEIFFFAFFANNMIKSLCHM